MFVITQLFLSIWPFLPTYGLLQDKNIFFFVPELRIKILYSVYCSAKVDLANNKSSPILAKNLFSFIRIFFALTEPRSRVEYLILTFCTFCSNHFHHQRFTQNVFVWSFRQALSILNRFLIYIEKNARNPWHEV